VLYDVTAVCVEALWTHVRRYGGDLAGTGLERRFQSVAGG
jgi:hypothetical protein